MFGLSTQSRHSANVYKKLSFHAGTTENLLTRLSQINYLRFGPV